MDNESINLVLKNIVAFLAIGGSIFAIIKFKIYRLFERRYRSEVEVKSKYSNNGELIVICTYIIHNTGDLPINLSNVSLNFYGSKTDNNRLICDKSESLLLKEFNSTQEDYSGLMKISAGERSEFPIRGNFKNPSEVLFVYGSFKWNHKREPSIYHHTILVENSNA